MIPTDLHYNFPAGAYIGLAVFIIAAFAWGLFIFRKDKLDLFSSVAQKQVIIQRSEPIYWAKAAAICLAWLGATLALMQPEGNGHYPPELANKEIAPPVSKRSEGIVQRKAHDVIFLVDASASMEVPDMRGGKSRFDYAKEVSDVIISQLQGENVALHAFTSGVTKLSPLTLDYLFVRLMLRQMQINEGEMAGTNLTEALEVMKNEYFTTLTPKSKTLIILTDGGDTKLEGLTGEERQREVNALLGLLDHADELQLNVITIGLGTSQGREIPNMLYKGKPVLSELDEALLKQISEKGRGKSYFANEYGIEELASTIAKDITNQPVGLEEYKVKQQNAVLGKEDLIYDRLFQIPLGLALLVLSIALLFPNTLKRVL